MLISQPTVAWGSPAQPMSCELQKLKRPEDNLYNAPNSQWVQSQSSGLGDRQELATMPDREMDKIRVVLLGTPSLEEGPE